MEAATSRNPREVGVRVLGLISGTSHDGIDCALVRWSRDGDLLTGAVEHTGTVPYPPGLREMIVAALPPGRTDMGEICRLDTLVGRAFAEAAAACPAADLVCSHGQTMFHWVEDGRVRGTLQLGQPAWIAERLGVPVVSDLRVRDVAAGGQGAPLVSAFDLPLLSGLPATWGRAGALNLGGIANLTLLPATGPVRGFDTGPANALMDAWCLRHLGHAYDRDGAFAASGRVDEALLARLLADDWFALPPPKSTGRDHFHLGWVEARLRGGEAPADVQATLTALSARTVADALRATQPGTARVLACGGGVHNPVLMAALAAALPGVEVESTAAHGVDPDHVEAMGFAWLARQTLLGLAGNLPEVTGAAGPRVLGGVYPA